MTLHLGNVPSGSTLYIPFATYDSDGASVTLTGLATSDVEIYANGGTTQRSSDAGYTLLDTDGIDFDSITGIHGFSIDLSDNTDAGFYAVGNFYWVVVSAVTIDSQTVNFIAATFRIVPAEASAGIPDVNVALWRDSEPDALSAGRVQSHLASLTAGALSTISDGVADATLDELLSEHTDAGSLGKALADVETDVTAILVDTGTTLPATLSTIDGNVDAILLDTAEIGAAGAGLTALATQASVDTIDSNVDAILVDTGTTLDGKINTLDTVADAIKAKTDSLTFTQSGQVDSNVQYVNDVAVAGTGAEGDEWGPA